MTRPRKLAARPLDARLASLYGLRRFGMRLGLETPRRLLKALGSPERRLRILHLAGSNGKGSTAAVAESVLRAAGWRTGLYTSPHLVDFAERLRVGGVPIGRRALIRLLDRVDPVLEAVSRRLGRSVTFFEATTAMAFLHFAESGVDVAVVETGLGGRFDATTAARPAVCVITPIALEHQRYLGRTLTAIAGEKAAILKRGVPVISARQAPAPQRVLARRARALGAPLAVLGRDFDALAHADGTFDYVGLHGKLPRLRCGLRGRHQIENAAVALAACERLAEGGGALSERDLRRGVAAARCPGRLEVIAGGGSDGPRVVLDGAHNPAAARTLAREIPDHLGGGRLLLVFGAMADKDLGRLTRPLAGWVRRTGGAALATAAAFERSAAPRHVAAAFRRWGVRAAVIPSVAAAVDRSLREGGPGDLVLVAGSLYVVGEARAHLIPSSHRRSVLAGPV